MADPKIVPRYTIMTPYEVYMQQVRGLYDNVRQVNAGVSYVPPQMGGLLGQRQVIQGVAVLELIDFEVK